MASNYYNKLYNDYEKTQEKLDSVLEELSNIRKEHKKELNELKKEFKYQKQELIDNINDLKNQLDKANKLNEKLQDEIDRLKNQNNKNSNNSSKPSSTNIVTPKKKTGANLYNYRTKTGKNPGGQYNHQGYNLSKKDAEKLINENKIEVKEIIHTIKGNPSKEPLVKYRYELEVKPYIEKHIFKYDKNSKEKLPKEFYTDVTYGNSIKTLSIHLGCYNVIAYDRLSDFFRVVTNNVYNICNGTLVNFVKEFGKKSQGTIKNLENNFLNGTTGYTDETGTKFNKKKLYVRNYSNEENVIYKIHKNKGHNPIKEDNILSRFCGGIMGDHDTTLYSYGSKNYECNIHLGRYLMELMENIPDTSWPFLMYDLIFRMNNSRKIAIAYGLTKFSDDKIKEYQDEYYEILKLAKEENKQIKSLYYKVQKAKPLYNRLVKYKQNHLYFIEDFKVPFDDNLSERDLRIFKNKTKVSGGFRSLNVAQDFADALSIIKTSIKRHINPFESIHAIFENKLLFAS